MDDIGRRCDTPDRRLIHIQNRTLSRSASSIEEGGRRVLSDSEKAFSAAGRAPRLDGKVMLDCYGEWRLILKTSFESAQRRSRSGRGWSWDATRRAARFCVLLDIELRFGQSCRVGFRRCPAVE